MADGKGTLYVIGSRKSGVLFVLTDPFRAAIVTVEEIRQRAEATGRSFDEAFGEVAGIASKIAIENDFKEVPAQVPEVPEAVGHWVAEGMTMSDADFCFISPIDLSGFSHRRNFYPPLEAALTTLVTPPGSLRDAVERDG